MNHDQQATSKNVVSWRPIQLSDVDHVMVWASDDRVFRYLRWDTFTSRDEVLNFIKNFAISHPWFRLICVDDRPVGWVYVMPNPSDSIDMCRAQIGIAIAFEYWGKGIVSKISQIGLSTIFKDFPHVERLETFVHPDNKQIRRLIEKLGFQREGLLRKYMFYKGKSHDMVVFCLLSSDFHRNSMIQARDAGLTMASSL